MLVLAWVVRQIADALPNFRAVFENIQSEDRSTGASGLRQPQQQLDRGGLPETFGPGNPKMEFLWTVRLSELRALTPWKVFVKPCVLMIRLSFSVMVCFILVSAKFLKLSGSIRIHRHGLSASVRLSPSARSTRLTEINWTPRSLTLRNAPCSAA